MASDSNYKKVLLIGRVVHAHGAFEELADVAEIVVSFSCLEFSWDWCVCVCVWISH